MAARLDWNTGRLWLGRLPLAQVRHTRKWGWQWTIYGEWRSGGYTEASVKDHCEALVRRLLAADGFRYRFLSVEPLVGPVDLWRSWLRVPDDAHGRAQHVGHKVDWVIVGGESGPKARPCNVEWVRDIVRQCREAGVPCFVKQMGSVWADENRAMTWVDKNGGRVQVPDHKGGDWSEWPEDLRVRQFPETP